MRFEPCAVDVRTTFDSVFSRAAVRRPRCYSDRRAATVRVPVAIGCAVVTIGLLLVGLVAPPYGSAAGPSSRPALRDAADWRSVLRPRPVSVSSTGFRSWALLNTRTGAISGSDNLAATGDTVSMVKAWLAADYLRLAAQRRQNPTAERMRDLSIMIRDSDNPAAEAIYRLNGATASIERLIQVCGLTDSSAVPDRWSETRMSARDAVRMGACLADGRAAGPRWTPWVLNEMRKVRGDGRFGIVNALPANVAATTAIKNGWLLRDTTGLWHVNCLAIGEDWVLAVMLRYPRSLGFEYGGKVCESVTAQLMEPSAAPRGPDGATSVTP